MEGEFTVSIKIGDAHGAWWFTGFMNRGRHL